MIFAYLEHHWLKLNLSFHWRLKAVEESKGLPQRQVAQLRLWLRISLHPDKDSLLAAEAEELSLV